MDENFNLSEDEMNSPIYRIIDYDRLIEMIESKENLLSRPSLWDDPFENLLRHARIQGQSSLYDYPGVFGESIYAQCWSFSEENDLLWRAYSQNKDGVRLKSTPKRLLESVVGSERVIEINTNPETETDFVENFKKELEIEEVISEHISVFIGKVQYLKIEEIKKYLSYISLSAKYQDIIRSVFIKREPFQDEREVRLGISYSNSFYANNPEWIENRFSYDIDINQLIDEIVFDPRISNYKFRGLKMVLLELGYINEISRSSIYDTD